MIVVFNVFFYIVSTGDRCWSPDEVISRLGMPRWLVLIPSLWKVAELPTPLTWTGRVMRFLFMLTPRSRTLLTTSTQGLATGHTPQLSGTWCAVLVGAGKPVDVFVFKYLLSITLPCFNEAQGEEGGGEAAGEHHGYQQQQIM